MGQLSSMQVALFKKMALRRRSESVGVNLTWGNLPMYFSLTMTRSLTLMVSRELDLAFRRSVRIGLKCKITKIPARLKRENNFKK